MTGDFPPALHCRNLSVGYHGIPVLTDLSIALEAGKTLALVGPSGCGKTTVLRTVAGIVEPLAGEVTVLGRTAPASPPRGELGYIPQGLGLVEGETVCRNVLQGTLPDLGLLRSLLGAYPTAARRAATEAIAAVGLGGLEGRSVARLSGGQRRRVAIARALVQEPGVLLADEILSELDADTAETILDCLDTLQHETGMAIILVEHNLDVARAFADDLVTLPGEATHHGHGSADTPSGEPWVEEDAESDDPSKRSRGGVIGHD